jgi:hypothetical protein
MKQNSPDNCCHAVIPPGGDQRVVTVHTIAVWVKSQKALIIVGTSLIIKVPLRTPAAANASCRLFCDGAMTYFFLFLCQKCLGAYSDGEFTNISREFHELLRFVLYYIQ